MPPLPVDSETIISQARGTHKGRLCSVLERRRCRAIWDRRCAGLGRLVDRHQPVAQDTLSDQVFHLCQELLPLGNRVYGNW